jgi:hypothetical protein
MWKLNHAPFVKEIGIKGGARYEACIIELYAHKLAKAGRIGVLRCRGIAEGLQEDAGLHNLILQHRLILGVALASHVRQVLDDVLRGLLPAPETPVIKMDWLRLCCSIAR